MIGSLALGLAALALSQTPATVDWQPCALDPDDTVMRAECATVQMPLSHDAPDERTTPVRVMRLLSEQTGARRQLWFLDGGPGDSGLASLTRVVALLEDSGVDFYTLDHRGVGNSALLECPDEQAADSAEGREITALEWPACIAYLRTRRTDLDWLTTTESAHDLGALIDATSEPHDQVILFGASYGTYWANTYLRSHREQVDGVILDGVVPADWTFAEFDADLLLTAERLMARCAEFDACAAHLGPDPVATARTLPQKFDEGHCADLGIDSSTVRLLLGNMLMGGEEIWPYIPPMIHRLDQCRLRDMIAIGTLFERLFESGAAGQEPESHSPVLQRHVALSEMWPDPPPSAEQLEAAAAGPMTTAVSIHFAATYEAWPRYPRSAGHGQTADYDGPMLMLHGELDPTLPPERLGPLRARFSADNQTFALIPDAGHVVISDSLCAQSLYTAFLADPTRDLDLSCIGTDPRLDLDELPETTESLFGTNDLWGDHYSSIELAIGAAVFAVIAALLLTGRWLWRRRTAKRALLG